MSNVTPKVKVVSWAIHKHILGSVPDEYVSRDRILEELVARFPPMRTVTDYELDAALDLLCNVYRSCEYVLLCNILMYRLLPQTDAGTVSKTQNLVPVCPQVRTI